MFSSGFVWKRCSHACTCYQHPQAAQQWLHSPRSYVSVYVSKHEWCYISGFSTSSRLYLYGKSTCGDHLSPRGVNQSNINGLVKLTFLQLRSTHTTAHNFTILNSLYTREAKQLSIASSCADTRVFTQLGTCCVCTRSLCLRTPNSSIYNLSACCSSIQLTSPAF